MLTESEKFRMDDRTPEEFDAMIKCGHEHEEDIVLTWSRLHNDYQTVDGRTFDSKMSFMMLGQRRGRIKVVKEDPGDALLTFTGKHNFSTVVEVKPVVGYSSDFRPQVNDVSKCIKYSRPYVLCLHYGTEKPELIVLTIDILKEIRDTCDERRCDPNGREYYNGKRPYYLIDRFSYPEFLAVDFNTLEPVAEYRKILNYLRECRQK